MSPRGDHVEAAIERWERARLVEPALAAELRAEAREHAAHSSRSTARYALAGTGALVLLVAVGVLGDWLWPQMGAGGRTTVLLLVGVAVHLLGLALRHDRRWRAASYGLQIAGLLVLLGTYSYTRTAWGDGTLGGRLVGLLALATPLLTAPASLFRRDPVMPAAHLALSLAFLAVFLDRTLGLSAETTAWVLDGVLLVMTVLLARELRGAIGEGDPAAADWALHAFVVALHAGFVLVGFTGLGPLSMEARVVYPLLLWVALVAALTLWGIHAAPPVLRRDWYERQLALALLLSIPLLFVLSEQVWDAPAELSALLVGGVGALGLDYAVRHGGRATLSASCLAVIVAAFYYGSSRGGALGVVLALAGSAALLFWVSTRVGRRVPPSSRGL